MRRKTFVLAGVCILALTTLMVGCATNGTPSKQSFITPQVELSHVEVAHYWGWWYFSKKVEPTKGTAGDYGAPLDLAFVFNVTNPNPYPVELSELKFTVAFEEFDLNTVSSTETQWIPPGKTNQLRVHAMFDGRQSLLSLLVVGGFKLKDKGLPAGPGGALQQLETWWVGIPEFAFPVHVKEGSAVFMADGLTEVTTFNATYP